MDIIDVNNIINFNPDKRIKNGYNIMKENYSKSSAEDFYNIYTKEPLTKLFEYSELIFSEPFYGTSYYKENMFNVNKCPFSIMESEYNKVSDYYNKYSKNMSHDQKDKYNDLLSYMESTIDGVRNTITLSKYVKENNPNFEDELLDLIKESDNNDIIELFNTNDNPSIFFTYSPYVAESCPEISNLINKYLKMTDIDTNLDSWRIYSESVITGNKVSIDPIYMEKLNTYVNPIDRYAFKQFFESSVYDDMVKLSTVTENSNNIITYKTGVNSVNNIFDSIMESSSIYSDDINEIKSINDAFKSVLYETTMDIFLIDYHNCDNTDNNVEGYTILKESSSYDDFIQNLNNLYSDIAYMYSEAADDLDDSDIDKLDNEINSSNPTPPQKKSLVDRISLKAMDAEKNQFKRRSLLQRFNQKVKGAGKAVINLPMNVVNSIKDTIGKLNDKDDNRRKKYMVEPGFRKRIFRNIKLATLYGTTAMFKLSCIPLVMIARHLSKSKNVRIRTELIREIETELAVCEEKINDAQNDGDKDRKYRLIRLRDKLKTELVRVKTNSKNI